MRVPMRTLIVTIVSHSGRTTAFIEFTFLEIYENFSTNSFWKTPMINAEARQKHVFHQTLKNGKKQKEVNRMSLCCPYVHLYNCTYVHSYI